MTDPVENSLTGRVALLTGASGGIGKALGRALADQGADLFLSYGHHGDDAEEIARDARELGRRVLVASADMADPAAPARLVEQAEQELGAVDILIANAGIGKMTDWRDIDLDTWHSTLAINLTAPFLLAQRVVPAMVQRGFGRVLFISSVAALNGGAVGAHYAASKAGLHGVLHHLAPRVAEHGVTVNALAPALIGGTGMLPRDPGTGEMPVQIPVGRIGRPEEVADMAMAMLRNGYLTNKVVTLDGGLLPR
jgi:3-oxoacyl-[acyl-carrier protein] reductase